MQSYINVIIGFILANIIQILNRNPNSENTPVKFDLKFFFLDSWQKLLVSLFAAMLLNYLCLLYYEDFAQHIKLVELPKQYSEWMAIVIGAMIDTILQIIRKQLGVFQPTNVMGNYRKYV